MALTDVNFFRIDGTLGSVSDIKTSALNGGPLAGFRNQIINGDFRVWQRGGGPIQSTNTFEYGPDRWRNFSNANNQLTRVNSTLSLFERACRVDNTSGTYTGTLGLTQGIETAFNGYPLVNGTQVTVSAYSTEPLSLDVFWGPNTLTSTASLVSNQTMTQGPIIEGAWRRYTHTFVVSTAGRTNADIAFNVRFRTLGLATWDITGVQLEPGPVATPFEHRPIGTELALCQRYFEASGIPGVSRGARWHTYNDGSGTANTSRSGIPHYFKVPKRVAPTMSYFSYDGTDNAVSGSQGGATIVLGTDGLTGVANELYCSLYFNSIRTNKEILAYWGDFYADAEL